MLKTTSIQPGEFIDTHNKALRAVDLPRPEIEVKAGDVVITCAGPRNRCGIAAMVRQTRPRLMLSGKMYRFRPRSDLVDSAFLEAFLLAPSTAAPIDAIKTGSSDNGMNLTHQRFLGLGTLVPPLPEQRRIVAKLDELRGRSRKAREALDAVPALLDKLKQSVLAAAFRGDLTAEWRAAQPPGSVEPASVLLDRIRAERRKRWEQANPKKAYVEPEPVDTEGLPELPEGWCWASLRELSDLITKGTTPTSVGLNFTESGVRFVKVESLSDGRIAHGRCAFIDADADAVLRRSRLEDSDVLVSIAGTLGRVAVVASVDLPANTNQAVALIRLVDPALARWASRSIVHRVTSGALKDQGRGAALQNLNLQQIGDLPIPIPAGGEGEAILVAVERAFATLKPVSTTAETLLGDVTALDQSILAKAFRGELVPQCPNDEPAEKLLARIKAEATDSGGGSRKGGRGRSAKGEQS